MDRETMILLVAGRHAAGLVIGRLHQLVEDERCPALWVGDNRLQSLTIADGKAKGNTASHARDSHATRPKGIPIRTLLFRSIH